MKKDIEEQIKKVEQVFDEAFSELNYLETLLEESSYKDSLMDVSDIKDYLEYINKYLNYLNDDFKSESNDLQESKKRKKKNYSLNKDAGNVEYNIAMFNHMNNSDKGSDFFPGIASSVNNGNAAIGEAVNNKEKKDVYVHDGPVTRFGKAFVSRDITYINANSPEEALNRASYIIKKKYGLDPKNSKVELNIENIHFVRSNKGKKAKADLDKYYSKSTNPEDIGYIDDPKYNDEESGRELESYNKWLDENFDYVMNKFSKEGPLNESLGEYAYNLYSKLK